MTDWVRVLSWHVQVPGNQLLTLCGLKVRAHPGPGEHQANGWETVRLPRPTCENCLRILFLREGTRPDEEIGQGTPE